jgi:SecD/SecF fusion protein
MRTFSARALLWALVLLLACAGAVPNFLSEAGRARLPDWYANNHLNLGLDLRGGSYLLLGLEVEGLMQALNQQAANELSNALRVAHIGYERPAVTAEDIRIVLRSATQADAAAQLARELLLEKSSEQPPYSIAAEGGSLRVTVRAPYVQRSVDEAVEQSLEVVRRRLDESGLVEPGITRQGSDRIEVQLPGVSEPQRIRELLGTTAKMDFHWLANSTTRERMTLPDAAEGGTERYELDMAIAMEGSHVRDARMGYDPNTAQPLVQFKLDDSGARKFGEMTRDNVGRRLAVVLDGKVITAPVIRTPITGGSGEISGSFTSSEAADLAVLLRAGALPAELVMLEERTVGPNLGSDSIRLGVVSGLVGAALVLGSMMLVYGQWGLIAWLGLCVNVLLTFAILGLLRGTLTLPGIAGIILGVGMAVDANILINERIREETRAGKSALQALKLGFDKAWAAILDSNITTLIAVSLLISIGSGPVRGFATTIGIGLLTSLFTVLGVTRLVMEWRVRRLGRAGLEFGGLGLVERLAAVLSPGGRVIDFMRAGSTGLLLSALLSLASLGLLATPGLNYGIDFSGGVLLEVHTANTDIGSLRAAFANAGHVDVSIQEFGSAHDFQLRLALPDSSENSAALLDGIKQTVQTVAPDADFPRAEVVGPRVSGDFVELSVLAVLVAGLGMLGYLWFRFENHFAVAAILTIVLDLTKTLGFFALSGVEFNLTAVAALLALIGYSVNDKVVVFDRVREKLRADPDADFTQVLNSSITTTLTRTVLTSGTTFLALLPMAWFGGAAVASFAQPLLFGIVVGTSSSIFIASPILQRLGQRRARLGLPQLEQKVEVMDDRP